jgi:hypothetical protein
MLWALAEEVGRETGGEPTGALESIGMLLDRRFHHSGYDTTPANALTFAGTGGDGVHFSLIAVRGAIDERSPVLMSVPAARQTEFIVGADFRDFMAFGARRGFFYLEQVAYRADAFFKAYTGASEGSVGATEEETILLDRLRRVFAVSPWPNARKHFDELQARYRPLLEPPPAPKPREPLSKDFLEKLQQSVDAKKRRG